MTSAAAAGNCGTSRTGCTNTPTSHDEALAPDTRRSTRLARSLPWSSAPYERPAEVPDDVHAHAGSPACVFRPRSGWKAVPLLHRRSVICAAGGVARNAPRRAAPRHRLGTAGQRVGESVALRLRARAGAAMKCPKCKEARGALIDMAP